MDTPSPDIKPPQRIAEALLKDADAASGALEAIRLFQQAASKMEQVLNDAKRMPHSDSPLLLSQFVVEGAKNALRMQQEGLALLPSPEQLQPELEGGAFFVDDEQFDKLIGPLNEIDVLCERDLIFVRHHPGGRIFRKVRGEGLLGRRLGSTPLHVVYRQP